MAVHVERGLRARASICRRRRGGSRSSSRSGLATLLPFLLFPNHLVLASQIAITALFALSLDLILGYAGIVSLGHAAFFGLGAYTAGIISKYGWTEPLVGLVVGPAVAGLAGYATSFIIARFRHLPLIMITMGLGFLLHEAANSAEWLTGGSDGLQGVRKGPLLGRLAFDLYGYTAYAYSLTVLFLVFLAARRLINSPFGLSLRGIRENPVRMPAIGAPSRAHIRKIYTISAVIAGIAGAVLTQTTSTVSLGVLDFQRSAEVLIILVLGGAGRLYGGLVGAIIFMVARDQFSGIAPQYWYFWIGALLVTVVMLLPNGMLGGLAQLTARWRGAVVVSTLSTPALSTQGLDKRFGSLVVASDINLDDPAWRALCADRAQRRRQDHAHQPDHRHAASRRRQDLSRRCRHHRRSSPTPASSAAWCAPSRSTPCSRTSTRSRP